MTLNTHSNIEINEKLRVPKSVMNEINNCILRLRLLHCGLKILDWQIWISTTQYMSVSVGLGNEVISMLISSPCGALVVSPCIPLPTRYLPNKSSVSLSTKLALVLALRHRQKQFVTRPLSEKFKQDIFYIYQQYYWAV